MTKIVWEVPIKTVSEANSNEHWHKKAKRHTQQQGIVRVLFRQLETPILPPCVVRMVRLAPRKLDSDNLTTAFKWIRDQIADCLLPYNIKVYLSKDGKLRKAAGRNDDNPLITWEYAQEKASSIGVRIEIETLADNPQDDIPGA